MGHIERRMGWALGLAVLGACAQPAEIERGGAPAVAPQVPPSTDTTPAPAPPAATPSAPVTGGNAPAPMPPEDGGGAGAGATPAPSPVEDPEPSGMAGAGATPPSTIPSVDGKWAEPGPFQVKEEQGGPDHTLYYPTELGRDGAKHPIIAWGNGTGATPVAYAALLRHWASHGFIVAAANTTWAGSGAEMLAGAKWVIEENARPGSPFYGKVDVAKVGAAGHSQGGGGAIAAGADPIVGTTIPIQPGPQGRISALHGPMFILGGASDTIVNVGLLVEPRYLEATHIDAAYGLLTGATHFEPVGDGGRMRGYMTAWFRLQLMDDEAARTEFYGPDCGLCSDADWTLQRNYE